MQISIGTMKETIHQKSQFLQILLGKTSFLCPYCFGSILNIAHTWINFMNFLREGLLYCHFNWNNHHFSVKTLYVILSLLPSGLNQGVTGLPLKGWPLTVSWMFLYSAHSSLLFSMNLGNSLTVAKLYRELSNYDQV